MAEDLGKNLDIWKTGHCLMSLRRVNSELLQVHTRKRKEKLKGSLEKHDEHKNMLKTVTLLNVKNGSSRRGRPN